MRGAIIHSTIVTMNPKREILKNAGILWDNGKIVLLGNSEDILEKAKNLKTDVIDAGGAFVFPGLINTHNHLFQHLLKGYGADMNLENWWPSIIGPAGSNLRECHLRAAVRGGALEALRCGTTTIVDYMQVHPVKDLSSAEIETAAEIGIRLIYGRGYRNYSRGGAFPQKLNEDLNQVFDEVKYLYKHYETSADGLTRIFLAPAAAWAVTFDGLKDTADFSRQERIPVTMHTFETETDKKVCKEKYGMRAIDYYEKAGILSPGFLAVHCVNMDVDDIKTYKEHDVKISHNPVSNMYLASGVSPVTKFMKQGMTVSLATDGAASNNSNNMLEVLKSAALIHKVYNRDPQALTARQVLEMATINGARAIGMENVIGSLEEGKQADMFIFDPFKSPTCCPTSDPISTLVYSCDSRGVITTIVKGKILLKDDHFVALDEEKILREEQEQSHDLAKKSDIVSN